MARSLRGAWSVAEFWNDIPASPALAEYVSRQIVSGLPFSMPLELTTAIQRAD